MLTEVFCPACSTWTLGRNCGTCGELKPAESPSRTTAESENQPFKGVVLDYVEYLPESGKYLDYAKRGPFQYIGLGERSSDGFTCLKLRTPGASRNFNVTVGYVYSIGLNGRRHVLEVPDGRWKLRVEEIRQLIEGSVSEWAKEYFDPGSPKYFKREPGYVSPVDDEYEEKLRSPAALKSKRGNSGSQKVLEDQAGCSFILACFLVGGLLSFAAARLIA